MAQASSKNNSTYNQYLAQEPSSTMETKKALPQNIEAEQSVLAACILDQEAIVEVAAKLEPENFYRPAHRVIYASMKDLYSRNLPIDQISLAENLQSSGDLDAAGGRSYIIDLANNTYGALSWRNHIDIVKRTSVQRDLIYASVEINALAYDAPDDLNAVVEESEKILFNVTEKRVTSEFERVDDLLVTAFDELTELASHKDKLAGVPTGFRDVDRLFHGLRGGDLIILAARPAVGKTAFVLNLATNAARSGTTVALLSLEMSSGQLIQRILCSEARVNLSKVRSGNIGDADWTAIADASAKLSQIPLYIDDTPALSIMELRSKARRQLRNVTNGIIIVDYLQLMQPPRTHRDGSREREVSEISRGLKILAKEMNMPVIALSQLSRAVETRTHKRPMLADLRESGAIEQDADIVMFLDRSMNEEEGARDDRPDWGTATLIVAKHRNGAVDDIQLQFNPEFTRFMDYFDDSRIGGM